MIRNIIFDVGNVLVEWECDTFFERFGITGEAREAVSDATVRSKSWDEYDRSLRSNEELLAQFIGNAPEYEREIRLLWENVGMTIHKYDYTSKWIKNLKENGYHVYILSNYSTWTYEHTKKELDFLTEADGALLSCQVHQVKPEPEIYRTLLDKFGLSADECIFLDDRQVNLDAAGEFGIKGIRFTSYEQALADLGRAGVKC